MQRLQRRWPIALVLLLFVPVLSFSTGEGGPGATPDELLARAMASQKAGYLAEVWDAQMAFFEHPEALSADKVAISLCLAAHMCPDIGVLGEIVGKSRADSSALDVFCARRLDERPDILDGLRGSCEEWAGRERWHLQASGANGGYSRDGVASLELMDYGTVEVDGAEHLQVSPMAAVRVEGGDPVLAAVDTGSTTFHFADGVPLPRHLVERQGFLDDYIEQTVKGSLNRYRKVRMYRLDQVMLGPVEHRHVVAGHSTATEGQDSDTPMLVGMSLLLRHGAVCFDWDGAKLHLGDLGPCASGLRVTGATLDGAMVIQLPVPVSGEREEKWPPEFRPYTDLSTMLVLLDTGATLTHCSKRFVQLNGGEVEFRLVGQDSPKFRCSVVVDHGFHDDGGLGYVELAYLGMDSLLEFAAVGWSLAPLTVYFLPRDGEEQVEEVGVGITGSGLRVRSPYR